MTVILETGYTLPGGDQPLTHARIAHANNWNDGGTISASTTDSDYFEDAPDNSLTYEKWKPTAIPANWETDLGSSVSCDYCAISAHDLGTQGCNISIQYYNGSTWVTVAGSTTITDDSPIFAIFEPVSAQRWRVLINSGTAPTIGVIRFGEALQMPRPIYGGHSPVDYSRNSVASSNISETGEFLGRSVLRTDLAASFAFSAISAAWVRANWGAAQKAIESEPFFIAWRPDDFGEVAYVQSSGGAAPVNQGGADLMSVTLSGKALAYD